MSKILTELPKKAGGAGRKPIYPYDEWLDGQIRQLEGGVDFQAKPQSAMASIRQMAVKRGMKLRTRFVNDGKDLVIQAYTDTPEVPEVEVAPVIEKSTRRPRTKTPA